MPDKVVGKIGQTPTTFAVVLCGLMPADTTPEDFTAWVVEQVSSTEALATIKRRTAVGLYADITPEALAAKLTGQPAPGEA